MQISYEGKTCVVLPRKENRQFLVSPCLYWAVVGVEDWDGEGELERSWGAGGGRVKTFSGFRSHSSSVHRAVHALSV